ncbi:hypothetical protein M0804_014728 [Polistes exclamans]|nr:hypothetical protein M0804_014728 [Polistes exclamans]
MRDRGGGGGGRGLKGKRANIWIKDVTCLDQFNSNTTKLPSGLLYFRVATIYPTPSSSSSSSSSSSFYGLCLANASNYANEKSDWPNFRPHPSARPLNLINASRPG